MNNELEIKGKILTMMKQPASYIMKLERNYSNDIVGYIEEAIKYPVGKNKELNEYIVMPDTVEALGLKLDLKGDLRKAFALYSEIRNANDGGGLACVAEKFVKMTKGELDNFSFKELIDGGTEIVKQIQEVTLLLAIKTQFRNL